jgi:hypothetical protein
LGPTLPPQYVHLAAPLAAPIVPGAPPAARQPLAARVPPPAPPAAAAGARANTAFPNSNYLKADFGRFRPLPIRVHDLLDRLVDTPPPSAPMMHLTCGTPGTPTSRSASAFPITLKANEIRAVGGPRTINPSPPTKRQELLAWCTEHFHAL